jgi:hypothetical protein
VITSAKTERRWPIQVFRAASLLWPSGAAWNVVRLSPEATPVDQAVIWALGVLWLATAAALLIRVVDASVTRRRATSKGDLPTWLEAADVLTATGCSMAWCGAAALVLSVWVGWASLSVVGLLGIGTVHLVALWTLLRAGGADPWRRASLSRGFVAHRAVEGDPVIEAVSFRAPRIPAGFRLFAKGRVAQRWPLSRYVVESGESDGDVRLERDVGPAHRGEHDADPLVVWLEDVLGLSHSAFVRGGGKSHLTVLPASRRIEGATSILGQGGTRQEPRAAKRLPTDGSQELREYQAGDDARRIHWLRSLTRGDSDSGLVVRLPDELPPDQPAVRLVLDTFFPHMDDLTCEAPDVLLDALVRVWLGTGRALVEAGVRVKLVTTAAAPDGRMVPISQPIFARAMVLGDRLGARARWQDSLPVTRLLSEERSIIVSHRLPVSAEEEGGRWIVVPAELWGSYAPLPQRPAYGLFPYPSGSADNRWSRRRKDRKDRQRARGDHAGFTLLASHSQERRVGHFVARSRTSGVVILEALQ